MTRLVRAAMLAAILAAILAAALLGAGPARGDVEVLPVPLPEGPDALTRIDRLVFWGGLVLTDSRPGFGGFSAIEVTPDGRRIWALSDQGRILSGWLRYDGAGRLAGIDDASFAPLLDGDGGPVTGSRRDAEGLARLADGSLLVSFEWRHRLALYPGDPARTLPIAIPGPADLPTLPGNRGIEALAVLPDGRTLLISETVMGAELGAFPAWLGGPGGWELLFYLAERGYRPTGAATLPSGDLVVIERRNPVFMLTGGRIVLVPRETIEGGAGIGGIELGRLVPPALAANYEGIAAWRDGLGRTRLLVISDNNFLAIQRTLLLQFVID